MREGGAQSAWWSADLLKTGSRPEDALEPNEEKRNNKQKGYAIGVYVN